MDDGIVEGSMPDDRRLDAVMRTLADVRCQKCNRLLCKRSKRPLRDGEVIEIKCWKCDDMNYLMGGPETT